MYDSVFCFNWLLRKLSQQHRLRRRTRLLLFIIAVILTFSIGAATYVALKIPDLVDDSNDSSTSQPSSIANIPTSSVTQRSIATDISTPHTTTTMADGLCSMMPHGYGLLREEAHDNTPPSSRGVVRWGASLRKLLDSQPRFEYQSETVVDDDKKAADDIIRNSTGIDCVVYTVFVGGYEKTLKSFVPQTKECHWVAFTDQPHLAGAPGWIVRPIPAHLTKLHQSEFRSPRHHGYAISKFVKMLPFLIFPPWIRFAVFLDGSYNVTNSSFVDLAVDAIVQSGAPILFKKHLELNHSFTELDKCAMRYKAVRSLDLLVQYFLAHVAEGMCDNWFDMKEEYTFHAVHPVQQAPLHHISSVLHKAYCSDDGSIGGGALLRSTSRVSAQRFLFRERDNKNDAATGPQRFACRRTPNRSATYLPMLDEGLLLHGIPQPSGPHVPLYDSSVIAYRLNHPDAAVRRFSEEFLKQWHRDSSLHGKDQIPLVMLLWRTPGYFPAVLGDEFRTPGYFPAVLGDEFRTRGGNLLWKSDHGK
ncbi:membrane-associated protein, putative [Bodo saltans]|uniref:Membrane-associated protein, putative n=1 Tax=Bodo saltans TaxID=75058 RepID=A0A0S4IZT1_BODSA|nr:membrane-associated protein, putative [Bodo saltans]|eukprot:CUG35891.1 membrane-associated protein, putative [Bodo saltans]